MLQLKESKQRRDQEMNNTLSDIVERKQRRKRLRMQKREAKEHIEKLKTYELLIKKFSAVDFFTFLLQHFRTRPKMETTIVFATEHLQRYLAELEFPGDPHKSEAKQVLTAMLEVCLKKMHSVLPEGLERRDNDGTIVWRLRDKYLAPSLDHLDALQDTLDGAVEAARKLATKATKVVAAWNKSGLAPGDDESSGEDEGFGAPKVLQAEVAMLRNVIEKKNRVIEKMKEEMEEQRQASEMYKSQRLHHLEEMASMKASMANAMAEIQSEATKQGVTSKWKGFAKKSANRELGDMQKEMMSSQQQMVELLAKSAKEMAACTPRPDYEGHALKDANFWLELHGLEPKSGTPTAEWVATLVKNLASSLEEVTYLRKTLSVSKNLDTPEVAQLMSENKGQKYIQCLGFGDDVPAYLRWKGRVRLRPIGKRELELLVRQVWHEKAPDANMEEHFTAFLKSRFGTDNLIAEWGYNLLHSLEQHRYDADCEMFLSVLKGEVSEEVKRGSDRMLSQVQKAVAKLADRGSGSSVDLPDLMELLRTMFLWKNEEELTELRQAAMRTAKERVGSGTLQMSVAELFDDDDDLCQSPFVECLRDQYLHTIQV